MMKYTALFLILFSSTLSFSQFSLNRDSQTDKSTKEYTAGAFAKIYYLGMLTGLEGGFMVRKHSFNLGVGVDPSPSNGWIHQNWGINFDYNYFPNGYTHRLDLFFDLNLIAALPYRTNTKLVEFVSAFNAGFGFNANLSQRLYLKFALGMGMAYWYKYAPRLGGNMALTIGYRF